MNYIVFDLEWNQSPDEDHLITDPICLTGEIIEIGAVKLNDQFETVDEKRIYICPKYYPKMHKRIAALTGIRDKDLQEKGLPFPQAFAEFQKWCGDSFSYMTWSTSDLPMLIENMQLHGIDTSELPDTYDVQRMFSNEIMRCDRRISLDDALKILSERGDTAHDALNDAKNTVIVCGHLDMDDFLQEYVSKPFAEAPLRNSYSDMSQVKEDESLRSFSCPWCGEEMVFGAWYQMDPEKKMAKGCCSEGDEFLLTMSSAKAAPGDYRVKRLMYEMSDDLYDYFSKKENNQDS